MKQFDFKFDYNGETRNVKKHWQFCVGSGHAALAHRTDYMEQLKIAHDELGMERVRFHGIFDDDMNVCVRPQDYLPVKRRKPVKVSNFYQIGKIYDDLLKIGVKPFVEIGFMPSALASGRKTVFSYKGNVTLPKKMEEWQEFIREFARFLIDRYGIEEVSTWYFEVWNEPNLSCFFKGDMQDYFRLYSATAKALKSVDERLIVGGPATTCTRHIPEFLAHCKNDNAPVDFVSTHQYPTDALGHSLNSERLREIRKIKDDGKKHTMKELLQPVFDNVNDFTPDLKGYMSREAERGRRDAGELPLFYTEWSISSNCVAAIHDTTRASSFLVKTVLDEQGTVDGSSYWTFSDIFEELFFFPEPFCGGFGLMTVDGIKKPAFWAMKLLSELPDTRYDLPITNDDVEMTAFKGEDDSAYVMLYAQNFDDSDRKFSVSLNIENAPEFKSVEITRINKESGNPYDIWKGMGSPSTLTREQIAEIQKASMIKTENISLNNENVLNTVISNNEVALIKLK